VFFGKQISIHLSEIKFKFNEIENDTKILHSKFPKKAPLGATYQ